ncbi:hypothetical protein GH714_030737 [Hevea brasiliensis]|uniref:Peptidase M50 domain-containing protein n=1 Tax=Hevea brasiliensis TaxID=3981 RepID=A0A6A6N631_HEVBR|nr:hypothetical protein GH714_030737 [Hevea brasiliensis]
MRSSMGIGLLLQFYEVKCKSKTKENVKSKLEWRGIALSWSFQDMLNMRGRYRRLLCGGCGVPVDPLAFAGLSGMVVTSLNLLPCGRLEGGRIAQAMFGRSTATLLSFATSLLLGIGGLSGSVLCLAWGLFATFFRGGEELPAKDEITSLVNDRYAWGFVLGLICLLTLPQ